MASFMLRKCLNQDCLESLPEPSEESRFCPFCGYPRYLPDPPSRRHERRSFRSGVDGFGSNFFYSYSSLQDSPAEVRGLSTLPPNHCSLFPSKWHPKAHYRIESSPVLEKSEGKKFQENIRDCLVESGRFFVLFENGRLDSYKVENFDKVTTFETCDWEDADIFGELLSGGSCIYLPVSIQGSWKLRAVCAAEGDPEPAELALGLQAPTIYVDGLRGAALGNENRGNRFAVVEFEVTGTKIEVSNSYNFKKFSGEPQSVCWWGQFHSTRIVVTPNGSIRCRPKDSDHFEIIWSNEAKGWVGPPVRQGENLVFPVSSPHGYSLSILNSDLTVTEHSLESSPTSTVPFPCWSQDNIIYFLGQTQNGDRFIGGFDSKLKEDCFDELLPGARDLGNVHLEKIAIQGRPHLVAFGKASSRWQFWALDLTTGVLSTQMAGSPSAEEKVSFLWEGANSWLVRRGARGGGSVIQCLPVD